jgi:hypothetical protein
LATTVALARLFVRRRHGERLPAALPLVSFTLVTALLLLVLGGSQVFFRMQGSTAGTYQALAVVALALLVVPLFTLGGAAARLSARRRDDRLSSLRLLGATTSTVSMLTVLEAAGGALAGAVVGTVLYAATAPLVGLVHFAGQAIGGQMWLAWYWLPAVWLAVALTAAASAAVGLRRVVLTPLGVRTRQRPGVARGRRAIVAGAIVLVAVATMAGIRTLGELWGFVAILVGVAAAFGCALLALDAVGPWYVRVRARRLHQRATDVPRLRAARMILEDPTAAWRQVAGVSVTTFVGVIAGAGLSLAQLGGSSQKDVWLVQDIRTGVFITLIASFLMVACTVAINQAATTLDRARVHVSLDRLGVPRTVLTEAQRRSVMSVLWTVVVGSGAVSAVLVLPLVGAAVLLRPLAVGVIVVVFAAGFLLVRGGASVAARLVPGVLARPERVL